MPPEPRNLIFRKLTYLLLTFPLGLAYFVFFITGFSVGFSLSFIAIGIPILVFMLIAARGLGLFERQHAAWALGKDLPPAPELYVDGQGILATTKAYLTDATTWKSVLYLFGKFFIGNILFGLVTAMFVVPLTVLFIPLLVLAFLYIAQPNWKEPLDKILIPMLRALVALPGFTAEKLAEVTLLWFGENFEPPVKLKHEELWREDSTADYPRKRKLEDLIGDDGELVDFPTEETEKQKRY